MWLRAEKENYRCDVWVLMEKYRDCQKELHCVFDGLDKAYERVPSAELLYCMRKE